MINTCLFGDVRDGLRALKAAGIRPQMVVTSPPYLGLRSYLPENHPEKEKEIGLKNTPDQYVSDVVVSFSAVRDILADDGVLWLNVGDSYAGSWGNQGRKTSRGNQRAINGPMLQKVDDRRYPALDGGTGSLSRTPGLKNKDLIGIPWRVAFALQGFAVIPAASLAQWADWLREARLAGDWNMVELVEGRLRAYAWVEALQTDGWYLRSDVIWSKPAVMPQSVKDRPTTSHEYVFLLSKSRRYFFDWVAIREMAVARKQQRLTAVSQQPKGAARASNGAHNPVVQGGQQQYRNKRSVWTIHTKPYKGAHFAVFPEALIEPCILAGTSERGHCPACGARWERVTQKTMTLEGNSARAGRSLVEINGTGKILGTPNGKNLKGGPVVSVETLDWRPSCSCGISPVPDLVLDPFLGSGTTAAVATRLGRNWVGCELNTDYKALQDTRIANAQSPSSTAARRVLKPTRRSTVISRSIGEAVDS